MSLRSSRRWFVASVLLLLASGLVAPANQVWAADHSPSAEEIRDAVDLFPAINANQVVVSLIPRSSKQVRLHIENKTDQPLTIRLPAAFAALPVLAQNVGLGNGLGNQGNNPFGNAGNGAGQGNAGGSQALGVAGGGQGVPGGNPFGGNNNQGGGNGFQPGGLFNVPAGKTVKLTLPSVCLEYGKTDPYARIPYEIRPLESFTDSKPVRELIETFGEGKCTQEVAQLAAWHLSNNMNWNEMASMTVRRANGHIELRFDRAALQKAKMLVDELPSSKSQPPKTAATATPVSLSRK